VVKLLPPLTGLRTVAPGGAGSDNGGLFFEPQDLVSSRTAALRESEELEGRLMSRWSDAEHPLK
jgi:hypothetical protein